MSLVMHVLNPLQPSHCEKHNAPLLHKRVYRSDNRFGIGDPELAVLMVGRELPHYLPEMYSDVPDEYHTEAIDVLVCAVCQSEFPEKLALARRHLVEREAELNTDVTGYFQLSALPQFTGLREILSKLQDEATIAIVRRLRADGLRWHVGSIKRGLAERYKQEAVKYGFEFIIA